jgi:hypothetical protein
MNRDNYARANGSRPAPNEESRNGGVESSANGTSCGYSPIEILKAGTFYFALVFGVGLVLGTVRMLWAVPRFGTRMAELMETPIMLPVALRPFETWKYEKSFPRSRAGRPIAG